jgi:oligopeptide/dipeptide ABC transporter ATP-binding protein
MNNKIDYVLKIKNLKTYFQVEQGLVRAVDGVTFSMKRGQTLALVGESGCGKSVTAYSILRLIQEPGKIVGGTITLCPASGKPIDITSLDENSEILYKLRGDLVSMVFQEPTAALSPVHTIGNQVREAILLHQDTSKKQAKEKTIDMLGKVGIPSPRDSFKRYPHEISGGMRQRAVIAMALVCRPDLLIADEPTTALDVTIQAQIMALIKDLQQEMRTSVLLITHDLGVVAQTADEAAVMYLGRIVEQAKIRDLIRKPRHPYTKALLKSLPGLTDTRERLVPIKGSVPSMTNIPSGCPFHPRCAYAEPGRCDVGGPPELMELFLGRKVACIRAEEIEEV